jgi:hypothetical protein
MQSVSAVVWPIRGENSNLDGEQISIFETAEFHAPSVGPQDSALIPHEIQESPKEGIRHSGSFGQLMPNTPVKIPSICIRRHCLYVFTKPRGDYSLPLNSSSASFRVIMIR